MNLRQFSMAILISALPLMSYAESGIHFNEGDFKSAKRITRDGETLLRLKLSKSGKAKLKKANKAGNTLHTDLAGISSDLKLKVPITGDGIEVGPFTQKKAEKISEAINDE